MTALNCSLLFIHSFLHTSFHTSFRSYINTFSSTSIRRFSVEGYPTTSEALGYLTSEQFGNTSGHWPRRKEKEKQRAKKLLSDLLQEGGDAAKAAVKSVRTQVRTRYRYKTGVPVFVWRVESFESNSLTELIYW